MAKMRCRHCYRDLLDGLLFDSERNWKACPKCSEIVGSHVFLQYPDDFGTSEKRITSDNPDGAQSHCREHRKDKAPDPGRTRICGQGVEPG